MAARTTLLLLLHLFGLTLAACAPERPGTAVIDGGVRFSLVAPKAKSVTLAGSFNRWDPGQTALSGPDRRGVWSITIPLPAGRYEYLFVLNGTQWVTDPAAATVDDGFSGKNSVLEVPAR